MNYTIIIPARMESTRLSEKAIADINGHPMIVHTAKRAAMSKAKRVAVATDSSKIADVCRDYDIEIIMTGEYHKNGSERVYEAGQKLGLEGNEIVINVQGDEPLINPNDIDTVAKFLEKEKHEICIPHNLMLKLDVSPNKTKMVVAADNKTVMYMSRHIIPYGENDVKKCLGLMGFRFRALEKFYQAPQGFCEIRENIEMLRAIEHQIKVGTIYLDGNCASVDIETDLLLARKMEPQAVPWQRDLK